MTFIQNMTNRIGRLIRTTVGIVLILTGLAIGVAFGWCRVYVPPGYCVVRIAKFGAEPKGTLADAGEKGIQRETLGPGRYIMDPISWNTKLVPLVEIKSGRPDSWTWVHTVSRLPAQPGQGGNILAGEFPEVGVVTRLTGDEPPTVEPVPFASNYKGVIREVLTPGVYRINPYEYSVEKVAAIIIPAGFVGVVTNQVGEQAAMVDVPDPLQLDALGPNASGPTPMKKIRPLAEANQRGTLKNVLPPGVYYLNPYVVRVKITEVGFNEFSQVASNQSKETIRFPSKSGFEIELGVTVVWGMDPRHSAEVINEFGNTHEVLEKVIKPQLRSICRNQGSLYEARDFIRGDKREEFQQVLTQALRKVCAQKNIELLLALISTVDVQGQADGGTGLPIDLTSEIQNSYLAVERQLTNVKLQETAKAQSILEEAKKTVDISRETVQSQTRKLVATMLAEGQKEAAQIEAQGRLQIAAIEQQIAEIDAEKTKLLGKARTDVEKLKAQAQTDGQRMLVEALGSGEAYNMYTFAKNFQPESIRLIFAGPGTFWTDLKKFEELGATQVLKPAVSENPTP